MRAKRKEREFSWIGGTKKLWYSSKMVSNFLKENAIE